MSNIIELTPTQEQKTQALKEAKQKGAIRHSIKKGGGNAVGFLAEIMLEEYLGAERTPCKDFDITYKGLHIDIKTKETTVPPRTYYDNSIAKTSLHQNCDGYIFCRYIKKGSLYVLGYKPKEEYFKEARELRKGDKDGDNGFIVRADCYNLRIDQLDRVPT